MAKELVWAEVALVEGFIKMKSNFGTEIACSIL
jgi:hypothetical protein